MKYLYVLLSSPTWCDATSLWVFHDTEVMNSYAHVVEPGTISPCSFCCNSLRIQHRAHRSFHWLLVAVLTTALKCLLAGKLEITKDLAHWSLWSLHIALADPEKRDVTPRLGLSNSALSVLPKFQSQRRFQHTCPITAVDSALGCVRLRKPGTQMSC